MKAKGDEKLVWIVWKVLQLYDLIHKHLKQVFPFILILCNKINNEKYMYEHFTDE